MNDQFTIDDQSELFWAEGQLAEKTVFLIEHIHGLGRRQAQGTIPTPLRAKSDFSIGDPVVLPLSEYYEKLGQPIPADIQLQMHHYDFYWVELACSFSAAEGCRFQDASFELDLQTIPADPNASLQTASGDAIAYDLSPSCVEDERKVSMKQSIGSPSFGSIEVTRENVAYQSRIIASGQCTSQPKWQFTRTDAHEIAGGQELSMILRKPKGTHVNATFSLAARVQFTIARLGLDLWPLVWVFRHRGNPNQPLTDAPSVPLDLLR